MKELVKTIIGSMILMGIMLGGITLVGAVIEWLLVDMGRYWLGMGIMGYIVARMTKAEIDK